MLNIIKLAQVAVILASAQYALAIKIHVINDCTFDLNVASASGLVVGAHVSVSGNGGTHKNFVTDDIWTAGRVWGFKEAVTSENVKPEVSGVTLAEFTSGTDMDSWDVSLVSGFNLPMSIDTEKPWSKDPNWVAECAHDFLTDCPADLLSSNGKVCQAAAFAKVTLNGLPLESVSCQGSYASSNDPAKWGEENCPSSNIPHYAEMKAKCPNSYIYPEDNRPSGSQTANGDTGKGEVGDFTVRFCPKGNSVSGGGASSSARSSSTSPVTSATKAKSTSAQTPSTSSFQTVQSTASARSASVTQASSDDIPSRPTEQAAAIIAPDASYAAATMSTQAAVATDASQAESAQPTTAPTTSQGGGWGRKQKAPSSQGSETQLNYFKHKLAVKPSSACRRKA